jgi:hypothetical protein
MYLDSPTTVERTKERRGMIVSEKKALWSDIGFSTKL